MYMKLTRHTPEQIVRKLRETDRLLAESIPLALVMRHLEIFHQTYQRWRSQYGARKGAIPLCISGHHVTRSNSARLNR